VNIIIHGWIDNKFREVLIAIFHLNCILKQSSRSRMNRTPSAETQITRVENSPVTVVDSLRTLRSLFCHPDLVRGEAAFSDYNCVQVFKSVFSD
jgi:hypothetical protein